MAHQRFGAQQLESEQMSTLHVKLHKEADKIRKWKIQTDMELKEKVLYLFSCSFLFKKAFTKLIIIIRSSGAED